ncbi:MAG: Hsp70 family protein [Anaerolineales bacterium]|nr:Hsp70 family protein [Anaerolineales bacterium]
MIYVGMDFGTSNSSIARFEQGQIQFFEIDPKNINPHLLRSFIYMTRSYEHFLGTEAIEQYLESETGRPVYWETVKVGTIENVWAGVPSTGGEAIHEIRDVTAEVDTAAYGRLLQSIKTTLRRPNIFTHGRSDSPRVQVFDRLYPVEDLIALLMQAMRKGAEKALGKPVEGVVIGRPVKFSDEPGADEKAEGLLRLAAQFAGFKEISFELEPVAAAHVYHRQAVTRENLLVFDFGGGTLDLTVMKVGGDEPMEILATHGVLLGGDDLDRALIRPLKRYFGEGATLADGSPLPAHMTEMLESWQMMVNLSRPRYYNIFVQAKKGSHPEAIHRLEQLVRANLGFALFQELEQAKIRLSTENKTRIHFAINGAEIEEWITRTQFEGLIREELEMAAEAVDTVLAKSGLSADQIHAVLRTGGSGEIPAFIEMLAARFGPDRLRALNPFETITGGLAIKAAEIERGS